ncbi:MAG: UDP-3-O-(3-hydroxymyristoyl)glucosamine N-acyltransferase [Alphaproteobacteria bacterium]|nr:UDP-3-O-(3-hydroxymyristoyl)glucosamine N-acyltransferase [Alphaproteobacteria bacterium]
MADPRFFENHGPFTLAGICAHVRAALPDGVNGETVIADVAGLAGAGAEHLSFLSGPGAAAQFAQSRARVCFVPETGRIPAAPDGMIVIAVPSVPHAFAATAALFYPDHSMVAWSQQTPVDPSASIGANVVLGPGVVIGANAEIGDGTRIGPNTVIGRGVCIGRDCEIASNVTITHAYVGDHVLILPGAQIGQPGFGFASDARGHVKIPQLGRVIIQDRVEIGACTTVDRGALGDTVIGEGTKIDNLVQVGHNNRIGRFGMIVGQVGISGSCELGDFVVLGGQVGLADHVRAGDGARFAARSGVPPGEYSGQDWGGTPPVPVREWRRQIAAVALLAKKRKPKGND